MNLPAFDAIALTNFPGKLECFFFSLEDLMAVGTVSSHYRLPQVLKVIASFWTRFSGSRRVLSVLQGI